MRLSYQDSKQAVVARGLEAGDKVVSENVLLLARQFALSQETGESKEVPSADAKGTPSKAVEKTTDTSKKP